MNRTLRVGFRGADVAAVQDALNQIGSNTALPDQRTILPLLVPDGVFGNKTYLRVKDFQQKNGLKADGVVGPMTLGRLQGLIPAVQGGMSTSRPAGLAPGDPGFKYSPHPTPGMPLVHPSDPWAAGSKTSSVGSQSSSGGKTSSSGGKTSKW
jgi:peptidoglycan hydrolase-like protein with peptidoglycan-binding domain